MRFIYFTVAQKLLHSAHPRIDNYTAINCMTPKSVCPVLKSICEFWVFKKTEWKKMNKEWIRSQSVAAGVTITQCIIINIHHQHQWDGWVQWEPCWEPSSDNYHVAPLKYKLASFFTAERRLIQCVCECLSSACSCMPHDFVFSAF